MARLSIFVVTSEIKYTEQYCYNKERKNTACQFYLITKKTTIFQEYTIAWKRYMYIKQNFNQHYLLSSRFTVQNSNGGAPNKHPPS